MSKAQTLFDTLQMLAARKNSPYHYLEPTLRKAKCFVLDDAMSAFLADLATQAFHNEINKLKAKFISGGVDGGFDGAGFRVEGSEEEINNMERKLNSICKNLKSVAKSPHAVTWIEFNFEIRYERYLDRYIANINSREELKNGRSELPLCGWLIEQIGDEDYRCCMIMGDYQKAEVSPFCYLWTTNEDRNHLMIDQFYKKENGLSYDEHKRIVAQIAFGVPELSGLCSLGKNNLTDQLPSQIIANSLAEMRGELRYVWSLLASINDLPVGIRPVIRSRGFMARGNYKKFMNHSVISLILPKRMTEKRLAKIIVGISRRRAHEVRGHFRLVGADKKRVWIKEHVRGDTSLGWVSHSYLVKHESN